MKTTSTILLVLVMTGAAIAGGEHDERAVKLLEEAIVGMGGDAALAQIEGFRAEYAGTYTMGEMVSPYTSKMIYQVAGRIRWDMESPGFEASAAVTGEVAWSSFMAPPARVRGGADRALREWLFHFDLMFLRPLLHSGTVQLAYAEKPSAEHVIVTRSDDSAYTLVFDRPVQLFSDAPPRSEVILGKPVLVAVSGPMTHMDGRKGRFEMRLSAPKKFGEVTLPSKYEVRNWVGDKETDSMEEELVSIEWNPEIGDEVFEMPALEVKLDEPAVQEIPEHTALVLVHEGPYEQVGESIGKAMGIALELGLMPAGPVTAVYLTDPSAVSDPADLRTEIRVPVALMGPPPPALPEGASLRTIPATKVATITVRGPYGSTTGESIGKILAWARENGHAMAGPPQVAYHHDEETTEPRDQLADVQLPVK